MQVDAGPSVPTHRFKFLAIVSREALVVDDFELERLSTVVDQTRPHDDRCRSQVVGVERQTYGDAIACAAGGRHLIRPSEPGWRWSNCWSPSKRLCPAGH